MSENEQISLAPSNSLIRVGGLPRCIQHRERPKRKHISTMPTPINPIPVITEKNKLNFWKRVDRFGPVMPGMQTPCWLWTAYRNRQGYGTVAIQRKPFKSHRVAFLLSGGVLTEQKPYCLHRCDNPACCNPTHLFMGSCQDNVSDKIAKGRDAKGEKNGSRLHPEKLARGENNGNCKLTEEQCDYIRKSPLAGRALSRELGVSHGQIGNIRRGKRRILPNNPQT